MHWSKSRHAQYESCPRAFFYDVIAAARNPEIAKLADSTGLPLRRHDTVRQLLSATLRSPEPANVPIDRLMEGARKVLRGAAPDHYKLESELSIVQACFESFFRHLPGLLEGELLHVHEGDPVEFMYDGITMMALPELVLDYPDRTEILCWKTGSSRYRKPAESLLLAGGLTCWARRVMNVLSKRVLVREVYLREDFHTHDQVLTDDELRDFVTRAKELRAQYAASAKIRDFPAKPGEPCRFCNFSTICPEYAQHFESDYDLEALAESVLTGTMGSVTPQPLETKTLFLSHASEDKERLVRPLARALDAAGVSYWLDEAEIAWGDSLTKQINAGLRKSTHVVVFISDAFMDRGWPESELGSTIAWENAEKTVRLLPVIDTDWSKVVKEYPLLRDKKYVAWKDGVSAILNELKIALRKTPG